MDMHWIASGAVLLVMAVLSAYRDALKNEPINRSGLAAAARLIRRNSNN